VNLHVNLTTPSTDSTSMDGSASPSSNASRSTAFEAIACPGCTNDLPADDAVTWQTCPYCGKRLQIRRWPILHQNTYSTNALSGQATCFFHPDKAFQACCQRCGRFVCALCDLQLGKEHVCPSCFERGHGDASPGVSGAEWRYRDVLYDSIALTVGWAWLLFWPSIIAAIPCAIFLHVKYRKVPRTYLIPRSGWRFWMAYVGLAWLPLLLTLAFIPAMLRRH
jgi:hypothetical protein